MSRYYKQMQHSGDEARHKLQQRLQRQEMGDEAYDKMVSYSDDRAFRIFGLVFIALFAVVVFGMAWLGY